MILTGSEITKRVTANEITIDPFDEIQINPNSYNYRLGPTLGVPLIRKNEVKYDFIEIPPEGYQLDPGVTYLGHTKEILGSDKFAMSLIGRSSLGRLGLFLQVSANLGHTGSCHQWTLEIVAARPFILHRDMRIGQISFWKNDGVIGLYTEGYSAFNQPQLSMLNDSRVVRNE
ncbi:dCTP deaminase [Pseudomonas viridiflava]|nr:deoxycytidine deaminase [Pseudomonas viridiflava]